MSTSSSLVPVASARTLGAPRRVRQLVGGGALLGALALGGAGCLFIDDRGPSGYYGDDYYYDDPVYVTIDTDEVLSTDLGEGAGLFVEYRSGGTWRLWTTCDTYVTGYACAFDVYAIAGSSVRNIVADDLEDYDYVDLTGSDSFAFYAETGSDYDAIEFETAAGASLQVELQLDGYVEPGYIFWIGDGRVHEGAPGSPVIFDPSDP
jgi:hypothetical protein